MLEFDIASRGLTAAFFPAGLTSRSGLAQSDIATETSTAVAVSSFGFSRMASAQDALHIMARFRIDLRGGAFRSVLGFHLHPLAAAAGAADAHHGRIPGGDAGRRADAALCGTAGRRCCKRPGGGRGGLARSRGGLRRAGGAGDRSDGAEASRLHRHHRTDAAHDGRHRRGRVPSRAALLDRLARQQLRRLDRAQDHARHVGARPPERHDPDGAAAVDRHADRFDAAARLFLVLDGSGRGGGLGRLHRR